MPVSFRSLCYRKSLENKENNIKRKEKVKNSKSIKTKSKKIELPENRI